ncbi:hypothetical protein [Calothrix rhizosoleniae]|uniref:hypothetical protein n=1 Tax=Calothrix rhizosoleniae TaxID=888997 RepID=UPI00190E641E
MKNLLKIYSTTKQVRIFTILFFISILSVSSELIFVETSHAAINNIVPTIIAQVLKNNHNSQYLPQTVVKAIVKDLFRRQGIPENKFNILSYRQRTWRNGCLEVAKPKEFCTQAFVDGWEVIVSDGNQKWVYHTNINGNSLRLANANIPTNQQTVNLPKTVKDAVLTTAAKRLNLPPSELIIMQVKQRTWRDGCLELADENQFCTTALVPGWRIIVGAKEQTLVYHLNQTGSIIKLNQQASEINIANLPSKVGDAVVQDASQRLGINKSKLRIANVESITTDSCLNLPDKGEFCTQIAVKAWQVSVVGGKQSLVYHAHPDGKQVKLNIAASRMTLPSSVSRRVLSQASQVSGLPKKSLRIVKSQPQQWQHVNQVRIPGWQVVVATDKENLIFLSDRRGNLVKLVNKSVKVALNNLPQNIVEKILAQASRDARLPVSQLQVVTAKPQQWTDSCLEINQNNPACHSEVVKGWQVTVSDGENQWVYRVGEVVKIQLDPNSKPITKSPRSKSAIIPLKIYK